MASDKPVLNRIDKESISALRFPTEEVLSDPQARELRRDRLHQATRLGNLEKHKVCIRFVDGEGAKEVYTTIWAVTDQKVLLKGGRFIPVQRITEVVVS